MSSFLGLKTTFWFTFNQRRRKKSYIILTLVIAIILFAIPVIGINILYGGNSKEDEEKSVVDLSKVTDVYILDENNFHDVDYTLTENDELSKITFTTYNDKTIDELNELTSENTSAVVVNIKKISDCFEMVAILPDESDITKETTNILLDDMHKSIVNSLFINYNISEEDLTEYNKIVVASTSTVGDKEKNDIMVFVNMVLPIIISMILMLTMYFASSDVMQEVSVEKTSKLVGTLLISTKPLGLIWGKVLAILVSEILRIGINIISLYLGVSIGNKMVELKNPEVTNPIKQMIDVVQQESGSAFSIQAIFMAVLFLIMGLLLFFAIASVCGSMISSAEQAQTVKIIVVLLIMVGYYISTLAPISGDKVWAVYLPIVSPFYLPTTILTGAVSISEGLISLCILMVTTILLTVVGSKLYKGLVMYKGNKLTLKNMFNILLSKK